MENANRLINFTRKRTVTAVIKKSSSHDFQGNGLNREVNARYRSQRRALPCFRMSSESSLYFLAVGLDICPHSFTPLWPFWSTSLAKSFMVKAGPSPYKTVFSTALCVPPSHYPKHSSMSCCCWQICEITILCCHISFSSNNETNEKERSAYWQNTLYPLA